MMNKRRTLMKGIVAVPFAASAGAAQPGGRQQRAGRPQPGRLAAANWATWKLQRRAGRPEQQPQVRDDGPVPAGADRAHPGSLRPRGHLLRYGGSLRPHQCERILGEAIQPFRNRVVITSKFGWNIDQETGQRRPGLNSKPDHVKRVVDGMLRRLRTDRIDLFYQHRVDPEVPIEEVAGAVQELMQRARSGTGGCRRWGSLRCAARTPRCP